MATSEKIPLEHPQVFINFRGAELRQSFVVFLESALKRNGVSVYVDGGKLTAGEDPLNLLYNGIEESRIALVILSRRYTESSWCLNELVKIKEQVEKGKMVAIPVFYKLNPSEVKELDGDFGLNLWNHVKGTSEYDKLKKWKEALDFVSRKMGVVFRENSDEADFVTSIAVEVKNVMSWISMEQIEKTDARLSEQQEEDAIMDYSRSEDLKGVGGERDGDLKSYINPKEAEDVEAEAKPRRDDGLDTRKEDNLHGETNSDAASNCFENDRVEPVIEEKEQENVSESSTMVTYDKPCRQHQVFISFRGAELRNSFVAHLLNALRRDGVSVYSDVDAKRGEDLGNFFKRIEESMIALVIFSSRYAESRWCLNELVKIKDLMDERKLLVIPIFYDVQPSEVKQLEGIFGHNSWKLWHIDRDIQIVKWKEALESVASIAGLCLKEHRSESDFIDLIVKEVLKRISQGDPTGEEEKHETYLFGMEQRMEQLEKKLEFDSKETRIIGVAGIPGIGKTTLAMMLHEKWNCKFIRCVALTDIREKMSNESYGPVSLRKTLLKGLLQGKFPVISDETTHASVKVELLQRKIFVVLDDVSDKKQLEYLLGDLDWIKKGSKIVITTSDKSLLEGFAHDTYVVPELNNKEAFQLLSSHAFNDQIYGPTGDFLTLSKRFVDYARGHPLALTILGNELRGQDKTHWESRLETVTKTSNMMFLDVWRLCTDQLTERQKDVFLDIVCFFISEDEYFVRSLLDSGDPDSTDGVSEVKVLANKFLIAIADGRVEMNLPLDTFSKDLDSSRWLRLWNYKDIIYQLKKMKISEVNNVRGIFLDMSMLTESIYIDRLTFTNMHNLRYLKIYDSSCPCNSKVDCKLCFPDGIEFPLKKLRYLHWLKFPLDELPQNFRPENLVDLRLPYSNIKRVWEGVKDTPRLKWVDLSHSNKLLDLSALSKAENLQRLNLEGCTILDKLPMEIQDMKSLIFLNMRGCTSLSSLPEMNLISLRTLILSGCTNLKEFKLISESLEVLHLEGTAIKRLPSSVKKLQRLVLLNLKNCKSLKYLPNCLGKLKALERLILSGCSRLKNLPDVRESMKHLLILLIDRIGAKEMPKISCVSSQGFADMNLQPTGPREWPRGVNGVCSLRRLCLSGNDFVSLQTDIWKLYNLNWLDVKQCKSLTSIPMLPPRLQYFNAHGCDSLERVANPLALPVLSGQIHATFNFSNCNNLEQDAKESIISYIRWKSQLVLDSLSRYNEGFVLKDFTGTCFPGREVPAWFSHKASGSVLMAKLRPHSCDNRFTGIALAAVILFPRNHKQRNRILVKCNGVFDSEERIYFSCIMGSWSQPRNTLGKIELSHVFIGSTSMLDIKKHGEERCIPLKASFEFQVTDGADVLEGYEVLKCGFSLVYSTDERKNICWDAKTVVIPERNENKIAEERYYENYTRPDDIQYESYFDLAPERGESSLSEVKSDSTPNLQKSFENKRVDLLSEESDAGEIIASSYTSSEKLQFLVGVELRLKKMEKLLYSTPGKTRIVGIVGMPGVGKTTLARVLFEQRGSKFPSHVFLTVSKECSLEQLRRVFLKELLKHASQDINENTTHESVKDKLLQSKIFVVLDDVSDKKQLEFVLGNLNWIKKGSKIVITTQNKSLLERLAHDIYVVQRLNNREAFRLFTYHAFKGICDSETFLSLSRYFVDTAAGNPLTLKLLGSTLYEKDEAYWKEKLQRAREDFDKNMEDVGRFSIDQLDERQRDLFLDIVHFFKSEDEYIVKSLLDLTNPEAMTDLKDLADKFLITISGGRVEMHDQLYLYALGKDLGFSRWLRLSNHEVIIDMLRKRSLEAKKVRGIFLDMSELEDRIALERTTFTYMRNLRYLKIYDSRQCESDSKLCFPDGLEFPLDEVRYLHWVKYSLFRLPRDFNPENLVDLRLPYSTIECIWEGVKDTPQLKWVDLSHSKKLLDLSALSEALNLLSLNLEGCTSLQKLPSEIQNMKSLVFLNMRGCVRLRSIAKMNLISLETLILSDCSNLEEFQIISENLEFLHLDGTAIRELPLAIENLKRLVVLNLKNCKMLERLPTCLDKLKVLDELILSGCSMLKNLPHVRQSLKHVQILLLDGTGAKKMPRISCFTGDEVPAFANMFLRLFGLHRRVREWPFAVNGASSLRRLCLSGNNLISLRSDIGKLYNLRWLEVKDCKYLRDIPTLPPRLEYFDAHGCDLLERVANPLSSQVLSEQIHATFNFSNCYSLDQGTKNNIISYTKRRSQLVPEELTQNDGGIVLEALTGTCFPGSEVPTWFSHRASGSVLKPKLPPHWRDNRFTGIGLCAVIVFQGYHDERKRVLVKCNCEFKNEDGASIRFSCTVGGWKEPSNTPRKIKSSHVFIGFTSKLDINMYGEMDDEEKCVFWETSLEFTVTDGTEEIKGYEVLKCGFSLVYALDERNNKS